MFPHCSSPSRGPPWGADAQPGFEHWPAVQQDDALLSELRRTLSGLRRTLPIPTVLLYRLHTAILDRPPSSAATMEVQGPDTQ